MGKILVVRVRLAVWVGETQLGGRMGGVMRIISAVWVRVAVWVFKVQFSGRMGGGMGTRSAMLDSCWR